jgi:hypothetical protein
MKKGQYFSLDAIVASIIFLLALTMLLNHWYGVRSQIDSSSNYLQYEAHRISNILLSEGDPKNWYLFEDGGLDLNTITRAGFGANTTTRRVELAYGSRYADRHFEYAGFGGSASQNILDPTRDNYGQSRDLLGTSAQYYVRFELNLINKDDIAAGAADEQIFVVLGNPGGANPSDPNWRCLDNHPPSCTFDIAKVERRIFVRNNDTSLPAEAHYAGKMIVYTWVG